MIHHAPVHADNDLDKDQKDGEALTLPTKDLGSTEVYPQSLQHSPNGRFIAVCGDGEVILHDI